MNIRVRQYREPDLEEMIRIWNEVVEDGVAFPQEELLTMESGNAFFAEQTYTAVAEDADTGKVYGLYILHPNKYLNYLLKMLSKSFLSSSLKSG